MAKQDFWGNFNCLSLHSLSFCIIIYRHCLYNGNLFFHLLQNQQFLNRECFIFRNTDENIIVLNNDRELLLSNLIEDNCIHSYNIAECFVLFIITLLLAL